MALRTAGDWYRWRHLHAAAAHAAVDVHDGPGDVRRVVGAQERRDAGHLLRLPDPGPDTRRQQSGTHVQPPVIEESHSVLFAYFELRLNGIKPE